MFGKLGQGVQGDQLLPIGRDRLACDQRRRPGSRNFLLKAVKLATGFGVAVARTLFVKLAVDLANDGLDVKWVLFVEKP